MSRQELSKVLDFILNRADQAELEVLAKAIDRRSQDAMRYADMGGLNPGAMAEKMAASINEGVQGSMDSLRHTVRGYVEKLIRRHAPEATEDQVAVLLDHYVGDAEAQVLGGRQPGLVDHDGGLLDDAELDTDLPPDALMMMVRDFTDYSLGLMPPSKQKELWDWMPRWQDMYWQAFPPQLKAFIKARLENRMDENEFWQVVLSLLGL